MPLISHRELKLFASAIFRAAGSGQAESDLVAEYLVRANLTGMDSHGIIRIPDYIKMVKEGRLIPNAKPKIVKQRRATAMVDAQFGYGQIAGKMAMELAIEKAKEYGTGSVAVFNCNHTGRIAEYTGIAAENDMIGLFMVKAFGSIVAPWGGRDRVLSTSPMSFAIPAASGGPIIADFATSISAEGKVRVKYARGEKIPLGWVLDSEGKPTDEPSDLYAGGTLLTFGESKGYALNLLMESLGGALTGAGILDDFIGTNGVFAQAINIEFFVEVKRFKARIDKMIRTLRRSRTAEGFKEVLLPGDPESREAKNRAKSGIMVEDKTWERIVTVARSSGVGVPQV